MSNEDDETRKQILEIRRRARRLMPAVINAFSDSVRNEKGATRVEAAKLLMKMAGELPERRTRVAKKPKLRIVQRKGGAI
jgi:hypothetical protein